MQHFTCRQTLTQLNKTSIYSSTTTSKLCLRFRGREAVLRPFLRVMGTATNVEDDVSSYETVENHVGQPPYVYGDRNAQLFQRLASHNSTLSPPTPTCHVTPASLPPTSLPLCLSTSPLLHPCLPTKPWNKPQTTPWNKPEQFGLAYRCGPWRWPMRSVPRSVWAMWPKAPSCSGCVCSTYGASAQAVDL